MFNIKGNTLRFVVTSQLVVIFLSLSMTISNTLLDLPHYFFGDKATSFQRRIGEVIVEMGILCIITCCYIKHYRLIQLHKIHKKE